MEKVYFMECHDSFKGSTLWYALQITEVGNVIDLIIHGIDDEEDLIRLAKKLSKRYEIKIDEPEERDPLKTEADFPIYRNITNKSLINKFLEEEIVK